MSITYTCLTCYNEVGGVTYCPVCTDPVCDDCAEVHARAHEEDETK